MKSIMLSIKPQWVEKILNGEKTIEIRKSKPSCELPVKVYIYCTKGKELWGDGTGETWNSIDPDENMELVYELNPTLARLNSKVVGEFILNKTECWRPKGRVWDNDIKKTCLTMPQLIAYADTNKKPKEHCYAWHIDNLKIYDKPKELSEFTHYIPNNECPTKQCGTNCEDCLNYDEEHNTCLSLYYTHRQITRPPQSYMFVQELEE